MRFVYSSAGHPAFVVGQEALSLAIIELNSMSPCDSVVMSRSGVVKAGYDEDADTLCTLIPAGVLARQLTADGLSSYSGKELRKWADAYDRSALQSCVDAAVQRWLDGITQASELLPLLRLFPEVASAELAEDGSVTLVPAEGRVIPAVAQAMVEALCAG